MGSSFSDLTGYIVQPARVCGGEDLSCSSPLGAHQLSSSEVIVIGHPHARAVCRATPLDGNSEVDFPFNVHPIDEPFPFTEYQKSGDDPSSETMSSVSTMSKGKRNRRKRNRIRTLSSSTSVTFLDPHLDSRVEQLKDDEQRLKFITFVEDLRNVSDNPRVYNDIYEKMLASVKE